MKVADGFVGARATLLKRIERDIDAHLARVEKNSPDCICDLVAKDESIAKYDELCKSRPPSKGTSLETYEYLAALHEGTPYSSTGAGYRLTADVPCQDAGGNEFVFKAGTSVSTIPAKYDTAPINLRKEKIIFETQDGSTHTLERLASCPDLRFEDRLTSEVRDSSGRTESNQETLRTYGLHPATKLKNCSEDHWLVSGGPVR